MTAKRFNLKFMHYKCCEFKEWLVVLILFIADFC